MSNLNTDNLMKYPRLCAHRGFPNLAPENSIPAYEAAVAGNAHEIEYDIWSTTDGVLVSCHDPVLDRVSDGEGKIYEKTYAELLELDFGKKFSEDFAGLKIATFEDILQKFSGKVIMNIHIKIWDLDELDPKIPEIIELIRKYNAQDYSYIQASNDKTMPKFMEAAPDINCALGWNGHETGKELVERAIKIGAHKVQFFKPHYDKEAIDLAHEHGIICNVFWSDEPQEAKEIFALGADCILTNKYEETLEAIK
jgi:glycerophosphoryl diester phosphodiesterase